jgi:hypothetical protein
MRKFITGFVALYVLLLGIVALPLYAASGVGASIGGVPVKLGPCDANFNRKAPNLCMRDDALSTAVQSTSCTAVTLPTNAKTLIIHYQLVVTGQNSVNTVDQAALDFYPSSSCTFAQRLALISAQCTELVAANDLNLCTPQGMTQISVPAGGLWLKAIATGGVSTNARMQIRGYTD